MSKKIFLYQVEICINNNEREIISIIGYSLQDALLSNGIPFDSVIQLHIAKPVESLRFKV